MTVPIYIFGAARSGTTWVQNLLGAHPHVATPQELDLFSRYVAPWHDAWRDQLPESPERWHELRYKGLPGALTEDQLVDAGRNAVLAVYETVLARKPGARVLVEKVPNYTLYTALIARYFPGARFVHVIRDGRDVAASHLRAASGWGRGWAANNVERAAWMWRANIEYGRAARSLGLPYLEVRYEELRSDEGARVLHDLFTFCGVDVSVAESAEVYERFKLDADTTPPSSLVWGGEVARRVGTPAEPDGFFGEGSVGGWHERMSAYERFAFARVAGPILEELGYEADGAWARVDSVRRLFGDARLGFARATERFRFAAGAAKQSLRRTTSRRPDLPTQYAPAIYEDRLSNSLLQSPGAGEQPRPAAGA